MKLIESRLLLLVTLALVLPKYCKGEVYTVDRFGEDCFMTTDPAKLTTDGICFTFGEGVVTNEESAAICPNLDLSETGIPTEVLDDQGVTSVHTAAKRVPGDAWHYVSSDPVEPENWITGQPTDPSTLTETSTDLCASMDPNQQFEWRENNCATPMKFACMEIGEGASDICSDNTNSKLVQIDDKCIVFFDTLLSWYDAKRYCEAAGAELLELNTERKNILDQGNYPSSPPAEDYWIGLTVMKYVWTDSGEEIDKSFWSTGDPDYEEVCAVLTKNDDGEFKLSESDCGADASQICAHDVPPVSCQAGWVQSGTYCYQASNKTANFVESRLNCDLLNATLASFVNAEAVAAIQPDIKKRSFIGLKNNGNLKSRRRPDRRRQYKWTDEESIYLYPLTFDNWNKGEPRRASSPDNQKNKYCVSIGTNGEWYSETCGKEIPYICSKKAISFPIDYDVPFALDWDDFEAEVNAVEREVSDIDGIETAPEGVDVGENPCPCFWFEFRGNCYHMSQEKLTFSEAKKSCSEKDGAELASITSKAENDFVKSRLSLNNHWIGLKCQGSKCKSRRRPFRRGSYRWEDKTSYKYPRTYDAWGRTSPARGNYCGVMQLDGKWNGKSCKMTHRYVCKTAVNVATSCSSTDVKQGDCTYKSQLWDRLLAVEERLATYDGFTCDENWVESESQKKCYFYGEETKSFNDAKADCETQGGSLTTISTSTENKIIKDNLQDGNYYIGLKCSEGCRNPLRYKRRSSYYWIDKSEYHLAKQFTSWGTNQPYSSHDCGTIKKDGSWYGSACETKNKYVCEKSAVLSPGTAPESRGPNACPSDEDLQSLMDDVNKIIEDLPSPAN